MDELFYIKDRQDNFVRSANLPKLIARLNHVPLPVSEVDNEIITSCFRSLCELMCEHEKSYLHLNMFSIIRRPKSQRKTKKKKETKF